MEKQAESVEEQEDQKVFFEIMSHSNIRIYTHKVSSIFKTVYNIHCKYDSQFPFILKMSW